uniref:Uncharacterized protein n=1 Tax=Oryza meridionalis TaxID=40149 RepID=A0A0E0EA90_9ORYZ
MSNFSPATATRLLQFSARRTFSLSPARHSPATAAHLLHSPRRRRAFSTPRDGGAPSLPAMVAHLLHSSARHSPATAARLLYSPTRLSPAQREASGSPLPGDMTVAVSTRSGAASSLSRSQH